MPNAKHDVRGLMELVDTYRHKLLSSPKTAELRHETVSTYYAIRDYAQALVGGDASAAHNVLPPTAGEFDPSLGRALDAEPAPKPDASGMNGEGSKS